MNGVDDEDPTRENIGDAVYLVLCYAQKSGSKKVNGAIVGMYPWWADYWNPAILTPEQEAIRKNITEYMFKYYETVPMSVIVQETTTEGDVKEQEAEEGEQVL